MRINDCMTVKVISVDEKTPLAQLVNIMKTHDIRRIPITKKRKPVGIITDRDVRDASPSKATTLGRYELNYLLLFKMKARDIMTPEPVTIGPDETIEQAASVMLHQRISGLPVVNEKRNLIGIITLRDLLKRVIGVGNMHAGERETELGRAESGTNLPGTAGSCIAHDEIPWRT